MPKQPRFTPILTDQGWMISIPPNLSGSGKRERYFFKTKKEAGKQADSLRLDSEKLKLFCPNCGIQFDSSSDSPPKNV